MAKLFFVVALGLGCAAYLNAQNIFEEKFEGCDTAYFITESDSISIKIKSNFVETLATNMPQKVVKEIRGVLSMQIIVAKTGSSCLLSAQNETNFNTSEIQLKSIIDKHLFWEIPGATTSVIIAIKFFGKGVEVKRIGMSKEKGYHEIPF